MATVTAQQVADTFLALCREHGDCVSNLKLQKLLYYAQGWHLALHGEPLFDDPIEAWVHGPVVPAVYRAFKGHGRRPIDAAPDVSAVPAAVRDHVRDVWRGYGRYTALELEELTHAEPPWVNARRGVPADEPSEARLSVADLAAFFAAERDAVARQDAARAEAAAV